MNNMNFAVFTSFAQSLKTDFFTSRPIQSIKTKDKNFILQNIFKQTDLVKETMKQTQASP